MNGQKKESVHYLYFTPPPMSKAYLSLGSNLGDKTSFLRSAIDQINRSCGKVEACSSFYSSAPWGFESSNDFINIAIILNTSFAPEKLLHRLQKIEILAGRTKKSDNYYHDRVLDIDIICFDDMIKNTPDLIIPHPHMQSRRFVLQPFADIAPHYTHPVFNKNIQQLLLECKDSSVCEKI